MKIRIDLDVVLPQNFTNEAFMKLWIEKHISSKIFDVIETAGIGTIRNSFVNEIDEVGE